MRFGTGGLIATYDKAKEGKAYIHVSRGFTKGWQASYGPFKSEADALQFHARKIGHLPLLDFSSPPDI
jgi:hypothetical protein